MTSNADPRLAVVVSPCEKPRRKRVLDDKACEVCNDKSTGKHYGVFVCDGCSGFFKRSVRRSIPWVCRSNGKCVVDKASRTECRACRFNKCLVVNMNPEGVQSPRGSRVPHDRKNTTSDSDSNQSFSGNPSPHSEGMTTSVHSGRDLAAYEIKDDTDTYVNTDCAPTLTNNNKHSSPVSSTSSPPPSMALSSAALLRNEPSPPVMMNRNEPPSPVMVKIEMERRDSRVSTEHPTNDVEDQNDLEYRGRPLANVEQMVVMQPSNIRSSALVSNQHSQVIPYRARIAENYEQATARPVIFPPDPSSYPAYPCPTTRFASTPSHPRCSPGGTRVRSTSSTSISIPYAPTESLYTMAVRLLSSAVKFAKNIPSFKLLAFRDQIILLEESWKDLFILDAAYWSFPLEVSYFMSPLEVKKEANASLVASFRSLQELVARVQALEMDETECAHLKTVVIFKPDIKGLKDSQQVEKLQDDAQVKFSDYVRAKNGDNPARFGRLLLTLLAFERVSQEVIEKLFFQSQNDKISVEYILHDMFKNT